MSLTVPNFKLKDKTEWHHAYAFDPGKITGVVEGIWSKDMPLQIGGHAAVLLEDLPTFLRSVVRNPTDIITEQFKARTNNQFVADDTPKTIEGMLEATFGSRIIHYRPRSKKEQVPDHILKDSGLWQTGKTVEWTDGRDANDATIHLLGYVAFDLRHLPTLRHYFKKGNK